MRALALLTSTLVAVCANAEQYPAGYAEDRAAIVDLQARYVMAMDYFDADGYAGVFTEDGVLDWARGLVEGRDAIYEFMASRTYDFTRGAPEAQTPDGRNWPSTVRHLITNQVIDVDGDTARALTYWIQFNNNADRAQVEWMLFGSWYDEFEKIDGEWFFTLHRIHNEGNARTFTAGQENPVKQLEDPPAEDSERPDLTGLWTSYTGAAQGRASGFGGPRAGLPLTEEGQRRVEEYRQLVGPERLNAAAHCADYGVPTMMSLPGSYPIEFIQKPDQLTIIFEVGNETRRIYIGDQPLPPEQRLPSRAGYSQGQWEGDVLVVQTTDLLDGQDQSANPFSEQATIDERFFVEEDANGTQVLTYEATITDPVYYTEPVRIERRYEPYDGAILPYSCQDELWYELLDLRRAQLEAGEPLDARMSDVYRAREDKE